MNGELLLRLVLAATLLTSGLAKLVSGSRYRTASLSAFVPFSWPWTQRAATALLLLELTTAVLLLTPLARVGGLLAAGQGLAFALMVGDMLARGQRVPCGCFGRLARFAVSPTLLAADLAIAGAGLAIALDSTLWRSVLIVLLAVVAGLAAQAARVKRRASAPVAR